MPDPKTLQTGCPPTPTWPWADELDALTAAPDHHALLLENEWVRVLETRIPVGARTAVHTHRWPSLLYIISWSAFLRRDAAGTITADGRAQPETPGPRTVLWSPPLPPHSLENVGTTEMWVVSVEIKQVSA